MGIKPAALAIRRSRAGVDVISSNGLMAAIDELNVSELLTPLSPDYDFLIIDSPPGKAMLAFNALAGMGWLI
jgi:cellulose biosynthesis protein BcsQ